MDLNYYQTVRVINRKTGQPTTLSMDHGLYIRACRKLRSVKAVNLVIRELALECEPADGQTVSTAVTLALKAWLDARERPLA